MINEVTIASPSGSRRVTFGETDRFAIVAGPCVVESESVLRSVAERLCNIQARLPVDFVFKSSYTKANRTSATSFTGIGMEAALALLAKIRSEYDLPILSDVHAPEECPIAAETCDILQIPAFLSRQTELLQAAGKTGRAIQIKKGQFMAPEDMQFAKAKVTDTGNDRVLLCERGTFFGYGDLVVDFRSIVKMRSFGAPVIYDATHSVQRPSQHGISGGNREFIAPLARAAMAVGIDGLFLETHPNPAEALSDRDSQLPLAELEPLIERLILIRHSVEN
ncbi:MAG: 3-deoxy-8-phosphooctulonate synthase [Candidatus Kapaibacterium sp.]